MTLLGEQRVRELVFNGGDWERNDSGLLLPPGTAPRPRYDRPVAIDLFAGCGGFSLGLFSAGWHVIAASEIDPDAAMTYLYNLGDPSCEVHFVTLEDERSWRRAIEKQNQYEQRQGAATEFFRIGGNPARPSLVGPGRLAADSEGDPWEGARPSDGCQHFWLGDVRKVTGKQILDALGAERGDVDAVVGGPPCQGFSISGKRDVMDPRNSLVFDFCRLTLEINPKTFIMENVPGMMSMVTPEGIPVLDAICRIMADGGFGAFDALKKALLSTAGLGASYQGARSTKGTGRKRKIDPDDEVEAESVEAQGALFGATA